MRQEFRGNCPITTALDVLGDKWMLVIVKQMLIDGKSSKTRRPPMTPICLRTLSSRYPGTECLKNLSWVENQTR